MVHGVLSKVHGVLSKVPGSVVEIPYTTAAPVQEIDSVRQRNCEQYQATGRCGHRADLPQ
jgi:hypothetical protein